MQFGSSRRGSCPAVFFIVHLLYLDDARSVGNPDDKHFVLAGITMFERQTYWLQVALEQLAENLAVRLNNPAPENLEFHGNPIRKGSGWWRKMGLMERRSVIIDALLTVRTLRGQWELFGVVVDKRALSPDDPIDYAFAQICKTFDEILQRLHFAGDSQRGLMILDKSCQETRLQSLATEFRTFGHQWGITRNLVDVPLLVDSRATRLIQYADLVSYALWRKFEQGDDEFYNAIADFFGRGGLHYYKK